MHNVVGDYIHKLENENKFLKERNKDLRQKTWYNVYQENLELQEAFKNSKESQEHMVNSINQLNKELKDCYESLDGLYQDFDEIAKENVRLKEVIRSVETFVKQFT
jgi:predicted RNase H-like nuclease (RuvC/YqgF family)